MSGTTVKWVTGRDDWTPFVRMLGRRLNGVGIAIGVNEDEGSVQYAKNGATIAEVALINELGAPRANIPARPFIRDTIDRKDNFRKEIRQAVRAIGWGLMPEEALAHVGEEAVREVRETLEQYSSPPNAPSTIRKKGENNPLIETHMLQGAINYKLVRGRYVPR